MNLVNQSKAANIAGVSRQAINKLKRTNRYDFFIGRKVNIDSMSWKEYTGKISYEVKKLQNPVKKIFSKKTISHYLEKKLEENLKLYQIDIVCGIYFLLDKGEIVYIGKSTDIHNRVHDHKLDKIFDSYNMVEVDLIDLHKTERHFINKYLPKYNKDTETMFIKNVISEYKVKDNE